MSAQNLEPLKYFGSARIEDFLNEYWQKTPLVVKSAFPEITEIVDGIDLFGLALEEEIEARVVGFNSESSEWTCNFGPFSPASFEKLGPSNWTLLVHSVDQWDEQIRNFRQRFEFLPDWRLDDLMISWAKTGGGVGPHYDNYDVFLIQARGFRCWELGQQCDSRTPLLNHSSLRLLDDFIPTERLELGPGDALYLPPGIAHCGTAISDPCITVSVGFRAPSRSELIEEAAFHVTEELSGFDQYRDDIGALSLDGSLLGVESQLRRFAESISIDDWTNAFIKAFGRMVTETRLIHCGDGISPAEAQRLIKVCNFFSVHYSSRSVFYPSSENRATLFVNGDTFDTSLTFAKAVCCGRIRSDDMDDDHETLKVLIMQGILIAED